MTAPIRIGQVLPYEKPRGVNSAHVFDRPKWFALMVQPQKEAARVAQLRRERVFAFYPTEARTRFQNGQKVITERPTVSRLIYARFRYVPNWDVMKDRRIITGVIAHDDMPVVIHPDIIRQIQGLPTRAEEIEAAKREMERQLYEVSRGDRATLIGSPLGDLAVEITDVRDGRVWWALPGTQLKGDCQWGAARKKA